MKTTLDGMNLHWTCSPFDPLLEEFLQQYDQAFVLPDEKETIEGFQACLALNEGPRYDTISATLGPYVEIVVVAKDNEGHFLGGANFLAYSAAGSGRGGPDLPGIALNYIFVHPAFRRQGLLARLVKAVRHLAGERLDVDPEAFTVFLEMNNPLRMDPEDLALDTQLSGIEQNDRLRAWERVGARVIDFPYVQPPLSGNGQEHEEGLLLAVIPAQAAETISSAHLQDHLARYFAISVAKGLPLPQLAQAQLRECQKKKSAYALLPPTRFISIGETPPQAVTVL